MRSIVSAICISLFSVTCAQGQLISSRKPNGLILSTGNLYFTSHNAAGAAVWRTSQSSVPGQESVLYWEAGAKFGDIVFAQVNRNFFGYFFAEKAGVITIKRVSLAGGNARVLATMSNVDVVNSHRNLVTDGRFLYWQDDSAIRRMPIGGGASTVLDRTRPNTPTAGIALQNGNVIYASVDDIRFVPANGSAITPPSVRTIAKASSRVTMLQVGISNVLWGEQNGAVRAKVGSTTVTIQSTTNRTPTSILSIIIISGVSLLAWTQCNSQSCQLLIELPSGSRLSEPIGADALGVTANSSGDVFWGDAAGVHRKNL